MRAVFGLVLLVGLGLAGFAVYTVKGYLEQQQYALAVERAAAAERVPTVDVYAVTRTIGYGERLTPEDVTLIPYAEPYLPEGVFRTEEELFPQGTEALRMVARQMEPNEPVLAAKVTEPGADAGITTRLTPGKRAFAISVDVASGVSGFLRPGDRVDVYWTGTAGRSVSGTGRQVTKLIETGLRLVAVDQTIDSGRSEASVARTVTVEVDPQQVAALAQAQASGKLSLALVGYSDETVAMAVEVDQRSLLGIVEEEEPVEVAPPPPPEEVCTIRTRRGSEVVEIPIPCPD
ncbi:Flp pilus assembly protein CpaB [Pseudoroseicyclus tamaricis]|uniref:Flp pilus assembly protein CpaB n=1 Tax=Pseudoroseicyclus tamaricis TaxID=2705421 RepID=A0A6B2JU22_9RHOB|nr:Flp pilus assembly protein CpaB [Pseudoroseicyclus tamaricis]NDV01788.1 Flp pilus assembly protein CpaB [Pseudoroseicyclus tamaricis]